MHIVDLDKFKEEFLHLVGNQFDNAIYELEKPRFAPDGTVIVAPSDITNGHLIEDLFPNMPRQVYWSIQTMMKAETNSDWWNARYTTDRPTCEDCDNFGTVNCSETYREPCKNDDVCETFERR